MSKKLSKNINFFEDYCILAIVSHLKDYTLCYHINNELKLDFIKYEDLVFVDKSGTESTYSWYYYSDRINRSLYYLIGNKDEGSVLIPSHKTVDYFLLVKDPVNTALIKDIGLNLRKIPNITAVFDMDLEKTKDMALILESIELHELEHVRKRKG